MSDDEEYVIIGGEKYLVQSEGELDRIKSDRSQKVAQQADLKQSQLDIVAKKRQSMATGEVVPPEKRQF